MRINYYCAERPGAKFATKECAREMQEPTQEDLRALERIGRYYEGAPRLVKRFDRHGEAAGGPPVQTASVESDTNQTDCKVTRRSTTGGALYHGRHALTQWGGSQNEVSWTSGESGYRGMLRAAAELLFPVDIMKAFHCEPAEKLLYVESSAAAATASRQGVGRMKHIATQYMSPQGVLQLKKLKTKTIGTTVDIVGLLTKHLPRARMLELLKLMRYEYRDGRAGSALKVTTGATREKMAILLVGFLVTKGAQELAMSETVNPECQVSLRGATTLVEADDSPDVEWSNSKAVCTMVVSAPLAWEVMKRWARELLLEPMAVRGLLHMCSSCRGGSENKFDKVWFARGRDTCHQDDDCQALTRNRTPTNQYNVRRSCKARREREGSQ